MLLWVFILFGGLTSWLLRNRSFYANWTTLFNVAASVYTSIMLAPWMLGLLPEGTKWLGFNCAGMVFVTSLVLFVVLEIVAAYVVIVEDVDIEFPKVIELIASKAAGFFIGFCTTSLLAFIILVILMQYEYKPWMKFIRTEEGPVQIVVMPVEKTCVVINHASLQCYADAPKNVVVKLTSLEKNEKPKPKPEVETDQFPDYLPKTED